MPLQFRSYGKTDIGLVRKGNEDNFIIDDDRAVFAVSDGMGGHQAGEVASQSSSETIGLVFNDFSQEVLSNEALASGAELPDDCELLVRAIRLSNRQIHNRATNDPSHSGMGTTIVAISLTDDCASIAHVGDSRAYLLADDKLTPLTTDHSWISEIQKEKNISEEEISTFVGKNVITRALGVKDTVEVDYRQIKMKAGDIYILCSDGLCGFASDKEIFETAKMANGDIRTIASQLIDLANLKGGSDNSTVIAIKIEDVEKTDRAEIDLKTFPEETPELLEAEDKALQMINKSRPDFTHPQGDGKTFVKAEDEDFQEEPTPVASPPNKLFIYGIFVVFIIVAGLIIFLNK